MCYKEFKNQNLNQKENENDNDENIFNNNLSSIQNATSNKNPIIKSNINNIIENKSTTVKTNNDITLDEEKSKNKNENLINDISDKININDISSETKSNCLHYIGSNETSTPLIKKSNAFGNHKDNLDNSGEFLKPYNMNDLNNNSDSDDEIKSIYPFDKNSDKSDSPPKEGINNKEISSNINIKKKELENNNYLYKDKKIVEFETKDDFSHQFNDPNNLFDNSNFYNKNKFNIINNFSQNEILASNNISLTDMNKSINYDDNNQININDISANFNASHNLYEIEIVCGNNFSFLNNSHTINSMNKKNNLFDLSNFPNQKDKSENNINNLLNLDIPPIPKANSDEFIIKDYFNNNSNTPIIIRKKNELKE